MSVFLWVWPPPVQRFKHKEKVDMKIIRLSAVLTLAACAVYGQQNRQPLAEPPQKLIGKDGKPETDLVDPFQSTEPAGNTPAEGGSMSTTSVNVLPKSMKILAIIIPEKKDRKKMAVLKLTEKGSPFVVKEGDLIKVHNEEALKDTSKIGKIIQRIKGGGASAEIEALKSFEYYLHIKKINSRTIEAFPKKSPDELIILRW